MIKSIHLPNKEFSTKEDLFKALIDNEQIIIDSKKAEIYKSEQKGIEVSSNQKDIEKILNDTEKGIKYDSNYYYFVVNSAYILDSHEDVHLDKCWNKSVKDQQGKVYLIWHHGFEEVNNIIGFPEDIESFTTNIQWNALGKSYEGNTYCLVYKILKSKLQNEKVAKWLEEGRKLQLSVRMRYREILFCLKSNNPDYAKQNENYNAIYPLIVNKEDFAEPIDCFFAIKQCENVKESSILPFGSNSATGEVNSTKEQLENTPLEIKNEQSIDTQIEEIPQKDEKKYYYQN